jgi:hypothetical protein
MAAPSTDAPTVLPVLAVSFEAKQSQTKPSKAKQSQAKPSQAKPSKAKFQFICFYLSTIEFQLVKHIGTCAQEL